MDKDRPYFGICAYCHKEFQKVGKNISRMRFCSAECRHAQILINQQNKRKIQRDFK
jgi:hypothetical protein